MHAWIDYIRQELCAGRVRLINIYPKALTSFSEITLPTKYNGNYPESKEYPRVLHPSTTKPWWIWCTIKQCKFCLVFLL